MYYDRSYALMPDKIGNPVFDVRVVGRKQFMLTFVQYLQNDFANRHCLVRGMKNITFFSV